VTTNCAIFDAGYNWDGNGNLITQTFSTGSRYARKIGARVNIRLNR
jgi:hypothetical protein